MDVSRAHLNRKMLSRQYRKSHCRDKMILRPSYLHNGISYTGKTASLYWVGVLIIQGNLPTMTAPSPTILLSLSCWRSLCIHQNAQSHQSGSMAPQDQHYKQIWWLLFSEQDWLPSMICISDLHCPYKILFNNFIEIKRFGLEHL